MTGHFYIESHILAFGRSISALEPYGSRAYIQRLMTNIGCDIKMNLFNLEMYPYGLLNFDTPRR